MGTDRQPSLAEVVVKTTVAHTVTYFAVGLVAFFGLDYTRTFNEPGVQSFMRPTDDPMVMAGPLFQPVRGLLFGLAFYLVRGSVFGVRHGWLRLWAVLVVVGVLGTFGTAPGSIEGAVYTTLPPRFHLRSLPELLVQSLALAWVVWFWVSYPARWKSWVLGLCFAAAMGLPTLGLLVGKPPTP